jgi:leader peptidase (prepilin peptidase)/N-methyltransferase
VCPFYYHRARVLVEELSPVILRSLWFVWGALWGSFFNVAIYRWPREMSVVSPPSHCPACGAPVPAWRNLPIFAYVIQRGRAACCGAKMTPRYLVVEVLTALLAVAVAERFVIGSPGDRSLFDACIEALVYFTFVGCLVIATFVDLEHMQIPDEVSLGGAAVGLATVLLREDVDLASLSIGAGAAYLFTMLVPVWAWERMTGQRGMGEGDAKLLLCIGAFLGWQGVLFVIAAASLQGTIGYFLQLLWRSRQPLPATNAKTDDTKTDDAKTDDAKTDDAKTDDTKTDDTKTDDAKTDDTKTDADASKDDAEVPTVEGDEDVDVVEVTGKGPLVAELDVDLPGKVKARARKKDGGLALVVEYRPDVGAPSAPHIRFGPFLSLAALEFLFFGQRIVDWYIETVFLTD